MVFWVGASAWTHARTNALKMEEATGAYYKDVNSLFLQPYETPTLLRNLAVATKHHSPRIAPLEKTILETLHLSSPVEMSFEIFKTMKAIQLVGVRTSPPTLTLTSNLPTVQKPLRTPRNPRPHTRPNRPPGYPPPPASATPTTKSGRATTNHPLRSSPSMNPSAPSSRSAWSS